MKWPLGNSGATYLKYVTDTVHTVQYSDSQCTVQVYTQIPLRQLPTSRSLSTLVLLLYFLDAIASQVLIFLVSLTHFIVSHYISTNNERIGKTILHMHETSAMYFGSR